MRILYYFYLLAFAISTWIILDFAFFQDGFILPALERQRSSFNRGRNGIWLRYRWYFGEHCEAERERLLKRLAEGQMRFAYFHVRSTDSQGKLIYRFPENARLLNEAIDCSLPGLKSIAWVYVPSKYEISGGGDGDGGRKKSGVDLSDRAVRKNLVEQAVWLVDHCGFDGVQWDYEFFPDGEPDFPALLQETRAALGKEAYISVASPMWYPGTLWGWSADYFSVIAKHCDQIAVMGYDSFFYFPRAYAWLMEMQVVEVCRAASLSGSDCKVMIGIPVYDGGTAGHITHTENIVTALYGVRKGLGRADASTGVFQGVSPFAEYTVDEEEWEQYRKWWLE
ncbi:hypothetical protein GC174_10255 [bacterium]|nr:hypothetical protein [bacterium]